MELELNKLESLVRRSEIAKLKAEARLELLRTANSEYLLQCTQLQDYPKTGHDHCKRTPGKA